MIKACLKPSCMRLPRPSKTQIALACLPYQALGVIRQEQSLLLHSLRCGFDELYVLVLAAIAFFQRCPRIVAALRFRPRKRYERAVEIARAVFHVAFASQIPAHVRGAAPVA